MEEQWFFLYHLKQSRQSFLEYPIPERRWLINRYLHQKEKEQEEINKHK